MRKREGSREREGGMEGEGGKEGEGGRKREGKRKEGRERGRGREGEREGAQEGDRERERVRDTHTHKTFLTIFFRSARAAFTGINFIEEKGVVFFYKLRLSYNTPKKFNTD